MSKLKLKNRLKENERKGYKYTKEEIDYIAEKIGVISTEKIAKRLGRSKQAIEKKALEIFGTAHGNTVQGLFNAEELSFLLGTHKGAVSIWIKERGLPAITRKKNLKEKSILSGYRKDVYEYGIDLEKFFDWLEVNKNNVKIDFNKVDMDSLYAYAPEWFKEDYKNKNHYNVGNRIEWSQKETETLLHLFYKEGKTLKEISEVLGRTYMSVSRKKQQLNSKGIFKPKSII